MQQNEIVIKIVEILKGTSIQDADFILTKTSEVIRRCSVISDDINITFPPPFWSSFSRFRIEDFSNDNEQLLQPGDIVKCSKHGHKMTIHDFASKNREIVICNYFIDTNLHTEVHNSSDLIILPTS